MEEVKVDIKDEIITINHYILKAIDSGDTKSLLKWKIMLDNLIKVYLKVNAKKG